MVETDDMPAHASAATPQQTLRLDDGPPHDAIATATSSETGLHGDSLDAVARSSENPSEEAGVSGMEGPPVDGGEKSMDNLAEGALDCGRVEPEVVEEEDAAAAMVNGSSLLEEKGEEEVPVGSLFPQAHELPVRPPRAIECNYTHWAALDVGKEFHDQYVYRHANGLCVIGLLPTHAAFKPMPAITAVDFNVGKQNRADAKVSGKRKKNAISLEPNSVLCKVMVGEAFFMIRCCVRGVLLEVNERLMKDPSLLNTRADTEGHIAIMMPRPEDWLKASKTLLTLEQYKERRGL